MTKHTAETTVSPKVIAPAIVNLILIALVAGFAAFTPDLLAALGPWAVPAYAAIAAVGVALAGYIKRDPLRE